MVEMPLGSIKINKQKIQRYSKPTVHVYNKGCVLYRLYCSKTAPTFKIILTPHDIVY